MRTSSASSLSALILTAAVSTQTALVRNVHVGGDGCGVHMAVMGGKVYFAGSDGTWKNELWASDGTAEGTARVSALAPGGDAEVWRIASLGSRVVFRARTAATGRELFVSDGTAAGTMLLKDIAAGAADSFADDLTAVGGKLWFTALGSLWSTDGTTAGTGKVADIIAPHILRLISSR
jgi:ELWxxDGT repeat protein